MTTITRQRQRHSHPDTTARKIAEVERLARAYQVLRREIVRSYWAPEHLQLVLHRPRQVITDRRRSGEAAANPLASHYQAQAVLDGLDVVRGSWAQSFAVVRSRAAKRFSDHERHEINWLLRWPEHLVTIFAGETFAPEDERFASNDHARLDRWLARTLRAARPAQPKLRHRLTLEADNGLFRVVTDRSARFPVWVSLSGLTKSHPLRIPMSGADTEFLDGTANLRVGVETDTKGRKRIVFRRAVKLDVTERSGNEVVGIDKGITAAITATSSDAEHALEFGTDYATALRHHSDRSFRPGRSRYWSLAKATADRDQTRRIRKHNLGNQRRERAARRAQAHLANITGRAAREMVEAFPQASIFVEEDLSFSVKNQSRPAGVNRRLAHWTKRRLSADIELHVSASGARRELANAAYTSQECPRCHWTDRGNRVGTSFRCEHCSYPGRADAVASSNVRSRGSDQMITTYTPFRAVKEILLSRHALWRAEVANADARCVSRGQDQNAPPTVLGGLLLAEQPF